ncbi:LpxA family transferase [Fulvivirgaceae bacterium PWU4]|uniref:LpxA family transferase n=1 Tax=Chryseosolibacter histidini TaxID=2782349 RepID=A0AAP2DPP7_9BACT|nr:LpxA family transferase [Chryseosolibacter histidini]MBT1699073.1 LpxA family transferase [Chryseosolibacter histidini]
MKNSIDLGAYLQTFSKIFPSQLKENPWHIPQLLGQMLTEKFNALTGEYRIQDDVAIHKSARIEDHAVIKGPAIISANCFIAAHAYLRGGVFLDERVTIGPGCEVKTSIVLANSALAHFNFVGDSIVGAHVNMEAGSVIANHYNEREQKEIAVLINGKCMPTGCQKFGALIGDHTKIGANAVLSPGTILEPRSVVGRLALVAQCG